MSQELSMGGTLMSNHLIINSPWSTGYNYHFMQQSDIIFFHSKYDVLSTEQLENCFHLSNMNKCSPGLLAMWPFSPFQLNISPHVSYYGLIPFWVVNNSLLKQLIFCHKEYIVWIKWIFYQVLRYWPVDV